MAPVHQRNVPFEVTQSRVAYVVELIETCLSTTRATRQDDWFRIGRACANIATHAIGGDADAPSANDVLLRAWTSWSKRPKQYTATAENSCREQWSYMLRTVGTGIRQLRISSIEEAARSDDPALFRKIQTKHMHQQLVDSVKTRDHDVAMILVSLDANNLRYKCVDRSQKVWYSYDKSRGLWGKDRGNNPLDLDIPTRVYDLLKKTIWSQFREEIAMAGDAEDDASVAKATKKKNECLRKLDPLKSNSKMNAVGSMSSRLLYDKDFPEKLDQNLDLVGLGGGDVFDLSTAKSDPPGRPTF